MKWRCTWCGKPHEENDPPCDNCGHNAFEKAIVRDESAADGETAAETEIDPETGTVDTGTQYLWICADCGRQHMRNNPPCSRCGSHDLEKTEQNYDDVQRELETPSWLEVAKPYLPVFAVIGIVLLLFATGIVPLSVLPGVGPPSPPDAPGNGSQAAGIDLEAAETEIHERLADERSADLAAYAEYQNRVLVANEYDDAGYSRAELADFGVDCPTDPIAVSFALENGIDEYADERALADAVAERILAIDAEMNTSAVAIEGLDLHVAPDDTVVVVYAAC